MILTLRAVGMEMTPAIKAYAEEKFEGLEKFDKEILHVDVDLGMETHHTSGNIFNCSVTLQIPGEVLKVERSADDLYKAIDKVRDHLREGLSQQKEMRIDKRRAEGAEVVDEGDAIVEESV